MQRPAHDRLTKRPRRVAAATPETHVRREVAETAGPEAALTRMQRAAGNAAVGSLIQRAKAGSRLPGLVQRAPNDKGWEKADTTGGGWNAKAQEVGATKIERIPIEGLTTGNQAAFLEKGSTEHDKTKESAAGKAVVLLPLGLNPKSPVDVMLHLHGFGYRSGDPYAGWRQDSGSGTVRDVEQDRIEEQMKAAADQNPDAAQTIMILVQGIGASDFGKLPYNEYAKEALGIAAKKGFPQLPAVPEKFNLVLSAHSGGGLKIGNSLGVDKKTHALSEPENLTEVVLMDAIHGWHADAVGQWAEEHMRRVREAAPDKRAEELAKCPKLRAFFSDQSPYPDTYAVVANYLKASYKKNPDDLKAALEARFPLPVHLEGAGHETVVRGLGDDPSAGPLANAIGAIHHPEDPSKVKTTGPTTWKGVPQPPPKAKAPKAAAPAAPAVAPARAGAVQRQPTETEKPKRAKKSPYPAGAITSSRLGELDSAEETKFRKDVYDEQFRRTLADPKKVFTVGLTPQEIGGGKVEGKPIHKDVAADAQALVDDARIAWKAAQADPKAPDHKLAKKCSAIGIDSAYRSIEEDFGAWQTTYGNALNRTKKDREALGDGQLFSKEALNLMVQDLLGSKATPGFSNHSKGLAMDFSTTQDGKDLGPHVSQRELWTKTWLHGWLVDNAAAKHFKPLSTEEWHWDHEAVPSAPTGDADAHGDAAPGGSAPTEAPAKTAEKVAPLAVARDPAPPAAITITFGPNAKPDVVAASSLDVLRDVLRAAGLDHATITSTARTAEDQARAMYQNLVGRGKGQGVEAQRALYGPAGREVVETFVELHGKGLSPREIQDGMRDKILAIGPAKVSNHCADPTKLNVFDVGPNSLGGDAAQAALVKAAQDEEGKRISKFIPYPKDPGDHFEIPPH